MSEIIAMLLGFAWSIAITATVVWDRSGPAVRLAHHLFGPRPRAMECYLCASWWISPPVCLAIAAMSGQWWASAAGAGLAIALLWLVMPAGMRYRQRPAPPSGVTKKGCCGRKGDTGDHAGL